MLDPVQLRTLHAVLHHGSFRRAAQDLGYTASAVSQQIASLERAIGFPLFKRLSKSVEPTDGALFLANSSLKSLHSLEELTTLLEEYQRGVIGQLKIGSFGSANSRLLPQAIEGVMSELPQAHLMLTEVRPEDITHSLLNYELDVVVNYQYEVGVDDDASSMIEDTTLVREQVHALLSERHPLAELETFSLERLANEKWIVAEESTFAPQSLRYICAEVGFIPKIAYHTNDYDLVLGMVSRNLGVGFVPLLAKSNYPEGILAPVIPEMVLYRYISAQSLRGTTNPLVPTLLRHLKHAGAQLNTSPTGVFSSSPVP